jgi:fructose-specific component phosphotransferase system IIB-like protein
MEVLKSCTESDLPDEMAIKRNKVNLPQDPKYLGKKVLLVDLDETLFHCDF